MWSSAAVVHLLQGSTCCAFKDGILHTSVVTSGYLSYCCNCQQPFHVQSHLNPLSSPFWCSVWTSESRLHHICHAIGWLAICYQAIEQVYLIKWPVSVYVCVCRVSVCVFWSLFWLLIQVALPHPLPIQRREALQQSSSLATVSPATVDLTLKVRSTQ